MKTNRVQNIKTINGKTYTVDLEDLGDDLYTIRARIGADFYLGSHQFKASNFSEVATAINLYVSGLSAGLILAGGHRLAGDRYYRDAAMVACDLASRMLT